MRGTRSAFTVASVIAVSALAACQTQPGRHSAAVASSTTSALPAPSTTSVRTVCHDNADCSGSEYCAFEPGLCGKGQSPGTCRAKPEQCASGYDPVCACSGRVYDNACSAHAAGEDLAVMGGCNAVIPDYAACGAHYCDARQNYCEIYLSDVFDLPTDHFCRPLPEACQPGAGPTPTCACFAKNTACLSFCGPLATGGISAFHLTCQGKKPPHS